MIRGIIISYKNKVTLRTVQSLINIHAYYPFPVCQNRTRIDIFCLYLSPFVKYWNYVCTCMFVVILLFTVYLAFRSVVIRASVLSFSRYCCQLDCLNSPDMCDFPSLHNMDTHVDLSPYCKGWFMQHEYIS